MKRRRVWQNSGVKNRKGGKGGKSGIDVNK
jgi:hypothetical protein